MVEAVIGVGGMGRVWRATDQLLGRTVAVKELFAVAGETGNDDVMARAAAEARAAARLSHPGIVTVHDVIVDADSPMIVMQFVSGGSLHQYVEQHGTMTPTRAAQVGLSILDALLHAHEQRVLHHDVKPSNVLLTEQGRIFVTDFSIARIVSDVARSHTSLAFGSPGYIAPERIVTGRVGVEGDYFGLGAVLYFLVEGTPPFSHDDPVAGMFASATRPHPPAVNAGTAGLAEVIEGLLVKEPRQRMRPERARELLLGASPGGAGGTVAPAAAPATLLAADAVAVGAADGPPVSTVPPPLPQPVTMSLPDVSPAPSSPQLPPTPVYASAAVPAREAHTPHLPAYVPAAPGAGATARPGRRWGLRLAMAGAVALALVTAAVLIKLASDRAANGPNAVTASSSAPSQPSRAARYAEAVLAARPVDYFPLRERTEATAANVASTTEATYHDVRLAAVEGPFGAQTPAPSFADDNGGPAARPRFVELPRRDSLLKGKALTVTMWFQANGPGVLYGTSKTPLLEYAEFGLEPSLYVGTDGLLHAGYYDSGVKGLPVRSMTTRSRVDDGRWHHVTLTKSADGLHEVLYLDGAEAGTRQLKGRPAYLVPSYAYLGAGKWTHWDAAAGDVGSFTGAISDFAYFDRVLSPEEVAGLQAAARG
ncbi:hypothetical protein Cs7R123_46820 [Catellatospora sp. TT07R-123]|nr:hypothetical protein Cs7R123_46820 [Catellatospora sp. TT07R-123]